MQFRLSTLFLIFFNVAATLALFAPWRQWNIAVSFIAVVLFSAVLLSRVEKIGNAIIYVSFLFFLGVVSPETYFIIADPPESFRRAACTNNLKQLGLALHNYHDGNKHFPSLNTCDKNGKPLFSWRVETLPYGSFCDSWIKDEPWNSPNNGKIASQIIPDLLCPSDENATGPFTNYVAVIGPGTAWREDGTVRLSNLPHGSSHTVMAVEIVNSNINWAEPRDLTVDEALEGIKAGKGLRVGSNHPDVINVLFADGSVRSMPAKMDISAWKKLFAGELKDLESIEYKPPSPPEQPIIILCVVVWLFSVILLFRRAVKSRRKAEIGP